jgi:RNA polymerase sigma factor (sigma-70 family)
VLKCSDGSNWALPDEVPLERLDLPVRVYHALRRGGIRTVNELLVLREEELLRLRNIGEKALSEIHRAISDLPSKLVTQESTTTEEWPQSQPIPSSPLLDKPIWELALSRRVENCLIRNGLIRLGDVLARSDEELRSIRGFGDTALAEVIQLRHQWIEWLEHYSPVEQWLDDESRRRNIALEHGIEIQPENWSWVELLNLGYEWETIESLDRALQEAALPGLIPLPLRTLVEIETVRYLLRIGCPLHLIPASRPVLSIYQHVLKKLKLTTVLQVCLSDQDVLAGLIANLSQFKADVMYYVDWLGTQSDWSGEVNASQPNPVALFHLTNTRLCDLADRLLARLPERNREIVKLRFGSGTEEGLTLQEIADEYHLTRERVRQILERALKNLASDDDLIQAFMSYCRKIVDEAGVISLKRLTEKLVEDLNIDASDSPGYLLLLLEVSKDISYLEPMELVVSSRVSKRVIQAITAAVTNQLMQAKAPVQFEDLVQGVRELTHLAPSYYEDRDLVRICLEAAPGIVHVEDDYWGLASWERRTVDDIVMVLRKLNRPAHFREIADLVRQRLGEERHVDAHSILAQLERYEALFIRTGRGTFGLREWDLKVHEPPVKLVNVIEQVLEEAGRPLRMDEIYRRVSAKREAKKSSVAMYLTLNKRFSNFSGNMYGLAKWKKSEEPAHVDSDALSGAGPALPEDFLEQLKAKAMEAFRHVERGSYER